jgi:2-amino-4-hydroxy-6-hydroxymethyldihydropteridine diphosphokinase
MKAIVALGSNLGDRFDYLQKAIIEIDEISDTEILSISNVYETLPVGGPEQGNYLNAVISINTNFSAEEFLLKLLLIELNLGRERTTTWGPRTLDLDLIWFDNQKVDSDNLTLPHPRAHERCFVIRPWSEIETEATLNGKKIKDLLQDLDCSGVSVFPNKLVKL